jgi:hypothetical protein
MASLLRMHDDDAQREARKNLNVRGSHLLEIFRTDFLYKWWNLSTVMNTSDCPTRDGKAWWKKLPGSGVSSVAACDARILQRWQQQEH